ncbi:predicted protein, partial [Nematostella vectensis]
DLLQLSDMYCLEGLKNVIQAQLRIEKCHLFHKPCLDCSVGVMETVEIAHIFNFIELKQTCIRWITKYFDRVMGLKSFAAINKQLQDEILAELQGSLTIMICIDHLKKVDRLKFNTPHIKWAEPVHIVLTAFMDSCLTFIAQNFPVISQREEFLDMLQVRNMDHLGFFYIKVQTFVKMGKLFRDAATDQNISKIQKNDRKCMKNAF